ncbi:hypothetical protein QP185_21210 [Sphingomonas aerolata]|uniref:hypothetical protein n=1 Tax=Sphingomonas aerolata TaxID=185951 RepID=UPI002FE12D20
MRTSFRIFGTAAAVLPMLLATVAAAQETPAPAPTAQAMEIQRLTALAALTEVQNKLLDTQNARFKAQVDALGLHKTEGKTTLAADAGKMETWMLAAGTLGAAAAEINQKNTAGPIVLLDSDDTLDLGRGSVLRHQIEAMLVAFESGRCADLRAHAKQRWRRSRGTGGGNRRRPVAASHRHGDQRHFGGWGGGRTDQCDRWHRQGQICHPGGDHSGPGRRPHRHQADQPDHNAGDDPGL